MDTQPTPTGNTLVRKLAEVMKEIGRIPKNGFNEHFQYSFVKEADLVEAIRDKLATRNVVLVPTRKRTEVVEMAKVLKNGDVVTVKVGLLHVTYTFHDGDSGETFEAESVGEIEQDGGKGIYKAATGAKKYMLLESFLVATGDDPEQDGGVKKQVSRAASPLGEQPKAFTPTGQTIHVVVHPKPPQKAAPVKKADPATPAQVRCIEKMASQICLNVEKDLYAPRGIPDRQPSKKQASAIIDYLKSLKAQPPRKRGVTEKEVEMAERAGMRTS